MTKLTARYRMVSPLQRQEIDVVSRTVNIGEAKARLSFLVAQAEAGEDVVIARDGVPAARIVPLKRPIAETTALLRQERARRQPVSASEIAAARDEGRA